MNYDLPDVGPPVCNPDQHAWMFGSDHFFSSGVSIHQMKRNVEVIATNLAKSLAVLEELEAREAAGVTTPSSREHLLADLSRAHQEGFESIDVNVDEMLAVLEEVS
jgi:hypothetical protein